ncbi:MAG: CoA transferase, partial [Candidatus Helarchaeota archaeon]|nr:CoA transferase [Candidatus Helarchaeota archaeon]
GKVYNFEQVRKDPQLLARNMVEEIQTKKFGTIKVPGILIKLSESPGSIRTPAPDLGEHNREILKDLCGFSDEKIAELKKKGII